jgi:hypothetical protein
MSDPHRIVAEISKTWTGQTSDTRVFLSRRFEEVIEENRKRGYDLESWKFSQLWVPEARQAVETIIAVFVRKL